MSRPSGAPTRARAERRSGGAGALRALGLGLALSSTLGGCRVASPCPGGLEECGGLCVDTSADFANCGRCGLTCGAAQVCSAGTCISDPGLACTTRAGGAFVTLGACGATVKAWVTASAFVDEADAIQRGTAPARIPAFDLVAGADCDAQWSFHLDPRTARFVDAAVTTCDGCPAALQADLATWVDTIQAWCPHAATVLAVDRRP